jgi:hypothetical protein
LTHVVCQWLVALRNLATSHFDLFMHELLCNAILLCVAYWIKIQLLEIIDMSCVCTCNRRKITTTPSSWTCFCDVVVNKILFLVCCSIFQKLLKISLTSTHTACEK